MLWVEKIYADNRYLDVSSLPKQKMGEESADSGSEERMSYQLPVLVLLQLNSKTVIAAAVGVRLYAEIVGSGAQIYGF